MANYKKLIEKRNREEEATAHAFKEFIDTFQNPTPTAKTFIKSGTYNAGKSEETDEEKGKLYTPLLKLQSFEAGKKAMECAKLLKDGRFDKAKVVRRKSNLETLKEELRLRHTRGKVEKCEVEPSGAAVGVIDPTDNTTNLFLTNLNPKLNESDLMQIFGVYGPLASVKIMWPRAEDRVRNSNVGFVAFMSRKDSERAYDNLGNREDMRISWGKPVDIPAQPVYIPPEMVKMLLPPPYTGLPFNAQPLNRKYKTPTTFEEMDDLLYNSTVRVTVPLDKKVLTIIHRMVEFVIREGPLFEAVIMHKEINNPLFKFLFENKSPSHVYYRWKLFSVAHAEGVADYSLKPFRMFSGGSIWLPPNTPDYTKGMSVVEKTKIITNSLSDNQQLRLIQTLRGLNMGKKKIAEAMVFCLKHTAGAKDVVGIITESFNSIKTNHQQKIARLYLISDILYNCTLKKTQFNIYLELFESRLTGIFEKLCEAINYSNDKNAFRTRVLKVLRAWELWKVYNGEFLEKLESVFLGDHSDDDEPLDGKTLINRSLGYNPDCVVQPERKPVEIQKEVEKKPETDVYANFILSKWETLDPAEIESQAMSTKKLHEIEVARVECEKREKLKYEKLREIELKVMKYQDDLESGKKRIKGRKTMEEELDDYRKRCIEKVVKKLEFGSDEFSSEEEREVKRRRKLKKYKSSGR